MFIIKDHYNIKSVPQYGWVAFMTTSGYIQTGTPLLFERIFSTNIHANDIQKFPTFNDARNFHMQNIYAGYDQSILNAWDDYDIYICELDNANNIVKETLSGTGIYILANVQTNSVNNSSQKQDDGLDYSKPGEALKAHKAGKYVDWKKLANKGG